MDAATVTATAILFAAALVHSSMGFGLALIAVPLLALLIPVEQAAPAVVLASITIASIILLQDWRRVQFRGAGWLLVSTLFGIPVGLLLLKTAPETTVKALLATVIIAIAVHSLLGRSRYELQNDRLAWLFGFSAGVLGGAYGMNGPPLVIYGALRRWPPQQFRATLQAYFLPASLAGMCGYWLVGLWTPAVSRLYLTSLPAIVVATLAGRLKARRIQAERFATYVYRGLLVIGLVLLLQAITTAV